MDAAAALFISNYCASHRRQTKAECSTLATVSAASAIILCLVAILSFLFGSDWQWAFYLRWVDVQSLVFDSILASVVLCCGLALLAEWHPAALVSICALATEITGYQHVWNPALAPLQLSSKAFLITAAGTSLAISFVSRESSQPPPSTQSRPLHFWKRVLRMFTAYHGITQLLAHRITTQYPEPHQAIEYLMNSANLKSQEWTAQASMSKSLHAAVEQYRVRHGIPPPPNFDKWYNFAVLQNSSVIDDFAQINDDLFPFWGMAPAVIRARTRHLLVYARLEMGGLRIRNGTVQQAPNIPGTHGWMMDAIEDMIQPFLQWLPDMDLAINLADESRVVISYEEMEATRSQAKRSRSLLSDVHLRSPSHGNYSVPPHNPLAWHDKLPQPASLYQNWMLSPQFTNDLHRQVFYEKIAPSCPPSSKARTSRWWDSSTQCTECAAPHSIWTCEGPILSNVPLALDFCHQPDVTYLNGFVMSSRNAIGTNKLFPVFSQSRLGGFSDILFPSPWNYVEKTKYNEDSDMAWINKSNSLFWRGSSTDGFAIHGSWAGFLRTRFVHEAYRMKERSSWMQAEWAQQTTIDINVTFTGDVSNCHWTDCFQQEHTYSAWAGTLIEPGQWGKDKPKLQPGLPSAIPFEESWRHQHLMDMDGAGFSGRFLPFLESHSLVYRAAAFRTWFDDRLQAWWHYVPVDIRLGTGFWATIRHFSANVSGENGAGHTPTGNDRAQKIACEGRARAKLVLRKIDMQIYMFRLLLEWGRVVDDNRENLAFV